MGGHLGENERTGHPTGKKREAERVKAGGDNRQKKRADRVGPLSSTSPICRHRPVAHHGRFGAGEIPPVGRDPCQVLIGQPQHFRNLRGLLGAVGQPDGPAVPALPSDVATRATA